MSKLFTSSASACQVDLLWSRRMPSANVVQVEGAVPNFVATEAAA
jgi:hypothetical protein